MSVTIGIRVVKMGFMRMAGRIMNVTRWFMTVAGGVMTVAVVVMMVKMWIMSIKMKIMTVKREIMTMKMWWFSKKVQELNSEKNLFNYFLTKHKKKWQHKMKHDQWRNTMSLWLYCMPH